MIKIYTLENLHGKSDVFEFMQGDFKHVHWHESSIFLTEEAFAFLLIPVAEVLPNFNYYGPNSVTSEQWSQVTLKCSFFHAVDLNVIRFFNKIDKWVQKNFEEHTCFSICGP